MITRLKGRDYISTQDWTLEEIETALDVAFDLKRSTALGEPRRILPDKTIFLIFFDLSTRTRNSFEAGITQLGGHAHALTPDVMQIAHGENAKDTGVILSRYGHAIAIRHDKIPGEGNTYLREVAKWADIPVINMQCDVDHPCQTLADIMTIKEKMHNDLRGRKMVVSWAYGSKYIRPMSVSQGLIMLMTRFGMDITLAHPPELTLMDECMEAARSNAARHGGKFEVVHDMDAAFENADIVYPKNWGVQELYTKPEEAKKVAEKYKDWICNEERMKLAKPDSIYMHALPVDRNFEATDGVIDGPHSVVYDEAENRLHTCKAVMALTMRD